MQATKTSKKASAAASRRRRYSRPTLKAQGPLTAVTLTSTSGGGGI